MKKYISSEKKLVLNDSFDVIVSGGGPAGCAAAAASAREGAKTLLIEGTGALGGMGTSGLVPGWCPFTDGKKIIHKGIAEEVFEKAKAPIAHLTQEQEDGEWCPIDPEHLKAVYDELVTGYGAEILFHSQVCAVEAIEDNLDHILVANKDGLTAYRASVYIDCTGDADLVAWSNGRFHKGADGTGELQPATHCFILSNIDSYALRTGPDLFPGRDNRSPIWEILKSPKYNSIIKSPHLCNKMNGHETVGFNAGHLHDVDGTSAESLSKGMIQGRKIARAFQSGLAEFHPKAFSHSYLAATAELMGIRETRRIIGRYTLTVDDYFARKSFDDEIARNCYGVDIHSNQAQSSKVKSKEDMLAQIHRNDSMKGEKYKPGESHGIPYRCLTPERLKNILVAGRSISCDRAVQGSIRAMPTCLSTGEAAGAAAALAVETMQSGINLHCLDTDSLRNRLIKYGVRLP